MDCEIKELDAKRTNCLVCGQTFTSTCYFTCNTASAISGTQSSFAPETEPPVSKEDSAKTVTPSEKQFLCGMCQREFSSAASLSRHMETHSKDRPHSCETCGKSFLIVNNLKRHMQSHSGDRPFKCQLCSKTFLRYEHLARHTITHSAPAKVHKCDVCDKTMSTASNLARHKQLHSSEDLDVFKCDICDKAFSKAYNLSRHMRSHTGERPYTCDVCPKSFTTAENLARHKVTHTGVRMFSCVYCLKAFTTLDNMNRHKRTHFQSDSKRGSRKRSVRLGANEKELSGETTNHRGEDSACTEGGVTLQNLNGPQERPVGSGDR